ncbi:MAG: hypothetical protein WDA07_10495 [Leucobacter sp.]
MATPINQAAEAALAPLNKMLDAIYAWDEETDVFLSSTDDDDDIIVVHDSRGRLIDLDVREGLQQELTIQELNEQISDALASNARRAADGIDAISEKLFAECAKIASPELLKHPVADQLAQALKSPNSERRQ